MNHVVPRFPPSLQQRRLWQLRETGLASRAVGILELSGDLCGARLRRALGAVMREHEVLRTGLEPAAEGPWQRVRGDALIDWASLDLRNAPPEIADDRLARMVREFAEEDFVAAHSPQELWLRARLLGLPSPPAHRRWVLVLALPAAATDRKGLLNLTSELATAYAALADGAPYIPNPMQYRLLAEWQREVSAGDDEVQDFWRSASTRVAVPVPLPEPTRRRRSGELIAGAWQSLGARLTRVLDRLAARCDCSVRQVVLAAWGVLIQRLAGDSVTLGVVFDGRRCGEWRGGLGLFSYCLPVPLPAAHGRSFVEMVKEVDAACSIGERWLDHYRPPGDGISVPFVGFEFEDVAPVVAADGVRFRLAETRTVVDRFSLLLRCRRGEQDLAIRLEVDPEALGGASADGFLVELADLLLEVSRRPEAKLTVLETSRLEGGWPDADSGLVAPS